MNRLGSVIAAVSTPLGKGGIAVIRISGPGAADITDKVFRPKNEKSLLSHAPRTRIRRYSRRTESSTTVLPYISRRRIHIPAKTR